MATDSRDGRTTRSPLVPPLVALGTLLVIQLTAHMAQVAFGLANDAPYWPPNPIAHMSLVQSDLRIISGAGQGYMAGVQGNEAVRQYARANDPWKRQFPCPPVVYRMVAFVNLLPKRGVHLLWLFAVPLCVAASLLTALRALVPRPGGGGRIVLALTLLTLLAGTPLVFQMERGNVDWIAFSLYMLALAGLSRGNSYGGGFLLGMATTIKLYPAILLPCVLLSRRLRPVLVALATIVAVIAITGPANNWQWLGSLAGDRVRTFGLHPCNAGLANLVCALGLAQGAKLAPLSYALFLSLVGAFFWAALARQRHTPVDLGRLALLAVPFMFLVPLTHWAYALFALPALLPLLSESYQSRLELRWPTLTAAISIGVSQSPFVAFRSFPLGLAIVMPLYAICVLALSLLSIWLLARGAADAPRATPAVSV